MFNLHQTDKTAPSILFGFGIYPPKDTADGFAILVTETEQRNVRFSTELSGTDWRSAGPFSYEVIEPMKTWRLVLAPNPTGLEFDLTWRARAPAWHGELGVVEGDKVTATFDHLFQSGFYDGTLTIDGDDAADRGLVRPARPLARRAHDDRRPGPAHLVPGAVRGPFGRLRLRRGPPARPAACSKAP